MDIIFYNHCKLTTQENACKITKTQNHSHHIILKLCMDLSTIQFIPFLTCVFLNTFTNTHRVSTQISERPLQSQCQKSLIIKWEAFQFLNWFFLAIEH